ncbi:hypothetical protein PQQ86_24105 [Paraburkholderia sediminicola]|uniref:hypothetical protein n=1 Tax=Paraburkholderia sediminicola TaxID=458836 RepID=UPI0038BDEC5E
MSTITTEQGIASLVNFLVGGTVSSADAVNAAEQARTETDPTLQLLARFTAAADLAGISGSTGQMLQQFASDSAEAGKLLGSVAKKAGWVGLAAATLTAIKVAHETGPANVPVGNLASIVGAGLGIRAAAVAAPEVAIALGFLAAGMTVIGWVTQDSRYSISNVLQELQGVVQSYYGQLSASDQAVFTSTLSDTMQLTLSGGMMVPQVDDSGWISGYKVEIPSRVAQQGDGSTLYTFESGVTYIVGTVSDDGPLTDPTASAGKSVWTVPETGTNKPLTLNIYQDGCYTTHFTDSDGKLITEVYITGSSATYAVAPMSTPSGGGEYQFVYVTGTDNQVTIHGDNNLVSLADGNHVIIDGANNIVHAGAGTTVQFGSADGNTIYNAITGETLTVADGGINVTGALNGGCGGEDVLLGSFNRLSINADGSKTLTLQYDGDDRLIHRTYNAAGVQIEVLSIRPDGSYADILYDSVTGLITRQTTAGSDGTGLVLKFNAAQQLIEQDYIRAGGSGTQFLKDPATGQTTGINTISGALLDAPHYDPATDAVTWTSRTFASVRSTATAYAEADHQAVQLVQAMAAYAPEPSVSTSLTAVPPENSQLLLAVSAH